MSSSRPRNLPERPLTLRQQRFVEEFMVDLNATQAAIRAGYSPKTAYSQGQRLLKNVEVQAALQAAAAKLRERTGIEQEDVIRENQRLAFTDIRDYLEVTKDGVRIKPSSEWTDDQARAVASVRDMVHQGGGRTIDLRLHDKQKALAEMSARLWPKPIEQAKGGDTYNLHLHLTQVTNQLTLLMAEADARFPGLLDWYQERLKALVPGQAKSGYGSTGSP